MDNLEQFAAEHAAVTRRYFLGLSAAGAAALAASPLRGDDGQAADLVREAASRLEYLTPPTRFRMFGRGKPPPHELPPEKLREVGLAPETWRLEVIADPQSNAHVERPLSKDLGTALDWPALMKLAEKHAVRFLSVMTCTNVADPCGMGLWEGVPLREVVWLAKPKANVRRVFYFGYHNDDPKQRFQSSLPLSRVLEDPPGEHPVILCYKLNGQWLSPKAGGPVRMLVPECYGNKSVKWLQKVVLTNTPQANDTYAEWNNDTESPLKTYARFVHAPKTVKAGRPAAITGLAQVGPAGLARVQYWLHPQDEALPADDPCFTKAPWKDAEILPPPSRWGGGLPDGTLPPVPRQVDPATGKPLAWPLRGALVHWAALLPGVAPGKYQLRCRTVDASGAAQPMPRPFPKSGNNAIQEVQLAAE